MKASPFQIVAPIIIAIVTASCTSGLHSEKDTYPPIHVDGEYVPRPEVVKIFIGGHFGPSYQIFSDGFTVRYRAANGMFALPGNKGETFTPKLTEWKRFQEELDRLNVWGWNAQYKDANVRDGTSWSVIVVNGRSRQIISSGSNAYPENFDLFLKAAQRLIDGRELK